MEVLHFKLTDTVRDRIRDCFAQVLSGFKDDGTDSLKAAQDPMTTLFIPEELVACLRKEIPEIVEVVCKNPRQIVHIENAPLGAPFGQGDDSSFVEKINGKKVKNREPLAEYFLETLFRAADLDINLDIRDNYAKSVTYPTPAGTFTQERGDKAALDYHVDFSFSAIPPAWFALGGGKGHPDAKTYYADTDKLLACLTENEIALLQEPVFRHWSGISTEGERFFRVGPILQVDQSGFMHFRGNFESNRLGADDSIDGVKKQSAEAVIEKLREACRNPENNFVFNFKPNDVIVAPNIFHSRNSYQDKRRAHNRRFICRFAGGLLPGTEVDMEAQMEEMREHLSALQENERQSIRA